jgi:hypothetical protein
MSLRLIPTRVHGVIDYLTSGTLLGAPELLRLKDVPSAALSLRLSGAKAAAYSLLTDYELGLVRVLPMPVHLALDAASGASWHLRPGSSALLRTVRATGCHTRS